MKARDITRQLLMKLVEVVPGTNCWRFKGMIDQDGYGRIRVDDKSKRAHIVFFEAFVARIPAGGQLRHHQPREKCIGAACCNPIHLKCRVDSMESGVRRSFCTHGHELTPENVEFGTWRNGKVRLRCKICRQEERKRRREKRSKT
jgi:hypothetical protein